MKRLLFAGGVDQTVYLTNVTKINGSLQIGARVSILGYTANNSFVANSIQVSKWVTENQHKRYKETKGEYTHSKGARSTFRALYLNREESPGTRGIEIGTCPKKHQKQRGLSPKVLYSSGKNEIRNREKWTCSLKRNFRK